MLEAQCHDSGLSEQTVVYLKFILLSMLECKYSKYTMDHVLVAYTHLHTTSVLSIYLVLLFVGALQ